MVNKSIALVAATLLVSANVNAAIVTHGSLTTDDTTNYIADTSTGRIYTRFDAFNMTYAETFAAVSSGGIYEGWSIANASIADEFYNAALGVGSTACDVSAGDIKVACGTISGWADSNFGASYTQNKDIFAYLNDGANGYQVIGLGEISSNGNVIDEEYWSDAYSMDWHGFGDSYGAYSPINLLLYKNDAISIVPIPSAVWLFGSGLIGLIGFARRKT